MEKAKAAVKSFTSKHGETTDVHESVRAPVTDQHIKPTRTEEVTTAVDREVHRDHHHTTIQPLQHREVLPESHTHNIVDTEHREFRDQNNDSSIKQKLEAETAQFRDNSVTHETQHTQASGGTVQGEHIHHHVHETVQPVIQKETIKPEVVHTTVPVHETHHLGSEHHAASVLPTKRLEDFVGGGGDLSGQRAETHEHYEGAPKKYNSEFQNDLKEFLPGHKTDHSGTTGSGIGGTTGAGTTSTGIGGTTGSGIGGTTRSGGNYGSGYDDNISSGTGKTGTTVGSQTGGPIGQRDLPSTNTRDVDTTTTKKPSLIDRLNPMKDTDGDGKKGLMD